MQLGRDELAKLWTDPASKTLAEFWLCVNMCPISHKENMITAELLSVDASLLQQWQQTAKMAAIPTIRYHLGAIAGVLASDL